MRKLRHIAIGLLVAIGIGLGGTAALNYQKSNSADLHEAEIIWEQNEDGSYTFRNCAGSNDSIYAWYVLDEYDDVVYKTHYTAVPEFIYDLDGDRNLIIKGFIRTDKGEGYDQTSIQIAAADVLGLITYPLKMTKLPENGRELLRNKILYSGYMTLPVQAVMEGDGSAWDVDLRLPLDWKCHDISNRSYGFATNGLFFLDETYREYCNTGNQEYAELIIAYVIDWASQNTEYYSEDEWVWHDDATAMRVLRMSIFYDEFKGLCSSKEQKLVEDSLSYQAQLLMSDAFYTKRHNHGMHQDIALLAYALLFTNNELQEQYISKALSRIGDYLDYVYTRDGIHKEHSPFYARDVLGDCILLLNLLTEISPEFSEHISKYVEGSKEYLLQIIKPDGTWPSLGDSSKAVGISSLKNIMYNNKEYLYLTSKGKHGTQPTNEMVFEEGGYAIFRSSWKDSAEDATWMLFNAATFSSTHKHGDDLEVLIFHKGDLFVEAGKRDYNYADSQTAWAYSGYGHNVLLVDGEAYPVKTGANGFQSIYPDAIKTGIIDYSINKNICSVTGSQYRFNEIEQTRTLRYYKNENIVDIEDIIQSERNYGGALLWHLAEGIMAKETDGGWNLFRGGSLIASVEVTGNTAFELETISGEGEWPYCTWIFDGKSNPAFGTLLKINFEGTIGTQEILTKVYLY